ncbi:hypothetical protein [Nitrososphaera sp.]|uniref:hypothetical protein n=2 Tax=Nitrososphaera sp. TaxID=1971748 RepID=UPI00178D4FEA|nr:hypothetical protein [Nitrososphaera sp.]NWG37186.1 hypothetical protein [Nitrososphaera sp.]
MSKPAMFNMKLLALAGIVILVAASAIALWPSPAPAEKVADTSLEQEIAQVAANPVVEDHFPYSAGEPASENIKVNDLILVTSARAVGESPVKVTLANIVTGQNLVAMSTGQDRDVVAEFELDIVVENTGQSNIAYATFDRFIVLDGTRVAAERIRINNLEDSEKVTVQNISTVTAGEIPSILRESVKQRLQSGSAPTFSVEIANVDYALH